MKSLLIISITILTSFFIFSCEEVIDPEELNLDNHESQIVIEGHITNQPGPYTISITKSINYFSDEEFSGVNNATVVLSDNTGQTETLTYVQGSEGLYQSATFEGIEGREYFLDVSYNGNNYTASCTMYPKSDIVSLTYRFKEATVHVNEDGYFITIEATDRPERMDYYRIKGYKNGILFNTGDDYIVENDYAFDGNNLIIECGFNYQPGDTARIEVLPLDYSTYQYYLSVKQQLSAGQGNNFTLPAGNIKSNIKGGATGIFAAYPISYSEIIITGSEVD